MDSDFAQFMKKREAASTAFVTGDYQELGAISTHQSPASIFSPRGDVVSGAASVNTKNEADAQSFAPGSANSFEIMHMAADGDVAYWAGIQHSKVKLKSQAETVPMDLRVTELFRKENGEWKLVHRHADQLK